MDEIESKYRVLSRENYLDQIKKLGGVLVSKHEHEDIFYDCAMDSPARTIRLRLIDGGTAQELTVKGPKRYQDGVKIRREENLSMVGSAQDTFAWLGWNETFRLTKTRETFQMPKPFNDVTVCVDHLHGVGYFTELEVLAEVPEHAVSRIKSCAEALKLTDRELVLSSYATLYRNNGQL